MLGRPVRTVDGTSLIIPQLVIVVFSLGTGERGETNNRFGVFWKQQVVHCFGSTTKAALLFVNGEGCCREDRCRLFRLNEVVAIPVRARL